ncbi:hypothetical protein [Prevotella sp. 10(H)]|uniref:hypothetical protein n=1 Tax=Prevotella sp. 10(H) TaxID=1158294 RepID=UPI0004A7304E|nr:hypothetical protein [Prevotella sp. 10(H)]
MQDSFKNRVVKFWNSFSEEEHQIREMMDNKVEGETLLNFVDSILQIAFNKVYFEMGVNPEGKYELILTPEGDRTRLMQIHYWLQYAPEYLWKKWNFYSTKPAHGKKGYALKMFGTELSDEDILIYPQTDNDKSKINIKVYSPALMELDESKRYSMFFIYLDQFIGELYTMEYIGFIDFIGEEQKGKPINIAEFKSFIDDTIKTCSWSKFENPCEIYSGYRMEVNNKEGWKLREDIFSGYTSCMPLLNDFYNGKSHCFDEAEKNGVIFGFLFFENINVPRENVVNFRGDIEDKITAVVGPFGIANCLGGATGFHFSYIDFIVYDFEAFLLTVKEIISGYNFEETGFSYFKADTDPIIFT